MKQKSLGFTPLETLADKMKRVDSRKTHRNEKFLTGFTLIEMLVAVAIVGLLAMSVSIALDSSRAKSRDVRRVSDIKQLQLALALYFNSNNSYPDNLSDLSPTFMVSVPVPPPGTAQAAYAYARYGSYPSVTYYHLGAVMENSPSDGERDCRSGSNNANSPPQCRTGVDATSGGFNGVRDDCTDGGGPGDECYDVTP